MCCFSFSMQYLFRILFVSESVGGSLFLLLFLSILFAFFSSSTIIILLCIFTFSKNADIFPTNTRVSVSDYITLPNVNWAFFFSPKQYRKQCIHCFNIKHITISETQFPTKKIPFFFSFTSIQSDLKLRVRWLVALKQYGITNCFYVFSSFFLQFFRCSLETLNCFKKRMRSRMTSN